MEELEIVGSMDASTPKDQNKCVNNKEEMVIFDSRSQGSLENHLSSNSDFKTLGSNEINVEELMKDPHLVNFVYSQINPQTSSILDSLRKSDPVQQERPVQNNPPLMVGNRLRELEPFIKFALTLGFVPIPLDGKKPVLPGWQKIQKDAALISINDGFTKYNANNIGVICGKTSGIVVIDIDTKNNGLDTWNQLISLHGDSDSSSAAYRDPYTFKVRTGSGGYHYYFKYDSDNEMLKSRSGAVKINDAKVGIDIKTNGGQVVFIGSQHPDTKQLYEWVNNNSNGEQSMPPISKMPDWLLSLLLETESSVNVTNFAPPFKAQLISTKGVLPTLVQKSTNESPSFILDLSYGSLTPIKDSNYNSNRVIKDMNLSSKLSRDALIELVNSLKVERAENYDDWIRVIWGIKTISPDYLDIADIFSRRTRKENYNEKAVEKVWSGAKWSGNGSITAGSLLHWLKEDNGVEAYNKFKDKYNLRTIRSSFIKMVHCQEHKFIVEYFIDKYRDDLKVINSSKGPYFLFNHRTLLWEKLDLGPLGYRISDILQRDLEKYHTQLGIKASESKEAEFKTKMQNLMTVVNQLIMKLAKLGFMKSTAECICSSHQQPEFLRFFDTKKAFIPVKGGMVVDIRNERALPRTRDHYFTYELNIRYDPNKVDPRVDSFFATLMLEDRLMNNARTKTIFLQTLLGYSLTGENVEKYLVILWGSGNNGKSTLIYLLLELFSNLIEAASKHIIIEKHNTGGPNSELDRLRICRMAIISETKESESLDEDIVKRITGGGKDKLNSRSLFVNDSSWSPHFIPFIVTNNLPKCSGDSALLNRILSFMFKVEFCDEPREDHQRKKDKDFDRLWENVDVQEAVLTWIVKGGARYYKEGLRIPKEVLETTEEFRKSRNSIELFLEDCTENCDSTTYTGSTQLYQIYEQYCGRDLHRESQHKFGSILGKKCSKGKHPSDRTIIYYGIRLKGAMNTANSLLTF